MRGLLDEKAGWMKNAMDGKDGRIKQLDKTAGNDDHMRGE